MWDKYLGLAPEAQGQGFGILSNPNSFAKRSSFSSSTPPPKIKCLAFPPLAEGCENYRTQAEQLATLR